MKVYITHGWRYAYDRSSQVYRAIKPKREEVNAYHREELLWQIEHIDVPHLQEDICPQIIPPSESFTHRLLLKF